MYTPLVYDVRPSDHNSLSVLPRLGLDEYQRLQDFYHFELDTAYGYDRAGPGEYFFGVGAIELKAGNTLVQPQVRDQNDLPLSDILMAFHWPDAPSITARIVATGTQDEIKAQVARAMTIAEAHLFWTQATVDPQYYGNAVFGWTDANGTVGWGYGSEAHIGDNGGPFAVWAISDPVGAPNRRVGSDCLKKIGFWDDHITPNPVFTVMQKEGSTPPPTNGGQLFLVNRNPDGSLANERIPFTSDVSGASGRALCLWQDGQIIAHIPYVEGAPVAPQGVFAQIGRLLRG